MKNNVPFQLYIFSKKWNGSGIEKEWKRIEKKTNIIWDSNQMEWRGIRTEMIIEEANKKWNGDGMEKKRQIKWN